MNENRQRQKIILSESDIAELSRLASKRTHTSIATRCQIVLRCAEGLSDRQVADRLNVNPKTVALWRKRFLDTGIDGLKGASPSGARKSHVENHPDETQKELKPANRGIVVIDLAGLGSRIGEITDDGHLKCLGETAVGDMPLIFAASRLLGLPLDSPEARHWSYCFPDVKVIKKNEFIAIKWQKQLHSTMELITDFLCQIKAQAESRLAESAYSAVIVVPEYYTYRQRLAIQHACSQVGIDDNVIIIADLNAMALEFTHNNKGNTHKHSVLCISVDKYGAAVSIYQVDDGVIERHSVATKKCTQRQSADVIDMCLEYFSEVGHSADSILPS